MIKPTHHISLTCYVTGFGGVVCPAIGSLRRGCVYFCHYPMHVSICQTEETNTYYTNKYKSPPYLAAIAK